MKYYKKFASCFLVKGYFRSVIYDVYRKDILSIDQKTFEVLNNEIISEKLLYTLPQEIVGELFEKEIIFSCHLRDAQLFPQINTEWITPFQVISSIIDIEPYSDYNIRCIIDQLNELGCRTLQLRFLSLIQPVIIDEILSFLIGKNIRSVELIMHFEDIDIAELTKKYKMVTSIIMYGAPNYNFNRINGCSIIFTIEDYYGFEQCGIIEQNYFVCNRDMFFESLNHNSCLNKKISVNAKGEIKNCPSCSKSFGKISDTNLKQVLEKPEFNEIWSITKDQIEVCRDCEFRYACTDCRVFIKDLTNINSQPAKCSYNPYIAKWDDENGYIPVEVFQKFNNEKEH